MHGHGHGHGARLRLAAVSTLPLPRRMAVVGCCWLQAGRPVGSGPVGPLQFARRGRSPGRAACGPVTPAKSPSWSPCRYRAWPSAKWKCRFLHILLTFVYKFRAYIFCIFLHIFFIRSILVAWHWIQWIFLHVFCSFVQFFCLF